MITCPSSWASENLMRSAGALLFKNMHGGKSRTVIVTPSTGASKSHHATIMPARSHKSVRLLIGPSAIDHAVLIVVATPLGPPSLININKWPWEIGFKVNSAQITPQVHEPYIKFSVNLLERFFRYARRLSVERVHAQGQSGEAVLLIKNSTGNANARATRSIPSRPRPSAVIPFSIRE
jgi:hypothetical protein